MKKDWINYILDPKDRSKLTFKQIRKEEGDRVIEATLESETGHFYEVIQGVPSLVHEESQKVESVESFEYEWNEFGFDYAKPGWLKNIVNPIVESTSFFAGKTIIDAGAGSGQQTYWMSEAGAKFIVSLELSNGARTVIPKTIEKFKENVFIVQGDLNELPINIDLLKPDLLYCVNVIQHVKNPPEATRSLARLINTDTLFMYNIYREKGREWLMWIIESGRILNKILPRAILKGLCIIPGFMYWAVTNLPLIKTVSLKHIPVARTLKEAWLDIYDLLGNHSYQKFYTDAEVEEILNSLNCDRIVSSEYGYLLKKK